MGRPLSTRPAIVLKRLVTAALDQRQPTPKLVRELNRVLTLTEHPLRLRRTSNDKET